MADVYFKIDDSDSSNKKVYFTNEDKSGYTLRTSTHAFLDSDNPTYERTVIIELYDDKFVLPNNSLLLFYSAKNTTTFNDTDKWDTSNVTDMKYMFAYCTSLTSLDLSNFDTSNVTDMNGMFAECTSLPSLDLSSFNTSKVTDMTLVFYDCQSLTSLDLSNFDTSNVTNMSGMFYECTSLTSLDLSSFNTSNVTYMNGMFAECTSLNSLDLFSFNTFNVTNMEGMFYKCTKLKTIYASEFFDTTKVTDSYRMFRDCNSLVGGNGTVYDASYIEKEYAKIDRPGTPGYFTQGSRMKKRIIYLRSNSEWLEYSLYQKDSEGWVEMEVYR